MRIRLIMSLLLHTHKTNPINSVNGVLPRLPLQHQLTATATKLSKLLFLMISFILC